MKKVSIVIPVYGQWNLVKKNIDALIRFDRKFIDEIIVVNDCSKEVNPYKFDQELVKIIDNEKNLGYTGTVNTGLRSAENELIVLLDSDAYPVEPFLQKLISKYSNDARLGCIGFSTINNEGNNIGNYQYEPSVSGLIAGQQLEARLGFLRFWRNKNKLPYSCAVSFRKSCLAELNYFDELLFPVLDADHDLSMRIHRSRWKLIFTDDIIVGHVGGNSYKVNFQRVKIFHKSRYTLLKKHGLIWYPTLTKILIKLRIQVELLILNLLAKSNRNNNHLEKIKGRELILSDIKAYN
ncbi:MAG: hypothetical protein JWN56_285 [Sphingobacteriales bacterium]|nr:hypothetical protein [Sphingobacteriales bacterium]